MKEIFQEYGGILITVVAILSIILVVTAVPNIFPNVRPSHR